MHSPIMKFSEGDVVYYQGGMDEPIECTVRAINEENAVLQIELMEKYETDYSMRVSGQIVSVMMHSVLLPV